MAQKASKKIKSDYKSASARKDQKEKKIRPMKSKYENQQISKIVNSYGGIGSLIQTREGGSLIIEDFQSWPASSKIVNAKKVLYEKYRINEDRLVSRLKREFFPDISGLFRIPLTDCKYGMTKLEEQNSAIAASFFPKYFFCPKCRKLKHLVKWQAGQKIGYPVCNCSNYLKKLEQVRFVLVSESGNISDVPWENLLDSNDRKQIRFTEPVNGNRNLTYGTSGSAESLSAISVHEKDNNENTIKSRNLGNLPEMTFIDENGIEYKMQLRQSNSIFYIKTVSSIFIPTYVIPNIEQTWIDDHIESWKEDGIDWDINKLSKRFQSKFIYTLTTVQHLMNYLNQNNVQNDQTDIEDEYRKTEFEYFLNPTDKQSRDLVIASPIEITSFPVKNLFNIKKLRLTTVQTGFCRIKPEGNVLPIGANNSFYYPAVEMNGEGVLFEFDEDLLTERISGENKTDLIKKFVHTFSHIIMKELEFECGYSVSTLKERLYCHFDTDENPVHLGVLVYALSGSDGSMGGLSSLFDNAQNLKEKNIYKIIQNAIIRARDCPNDPICGTEEDLVNGNKASCYACTLIPETSCEQFNKELDREILNTLLNSPA